MNDGCHDATRSKSEKFTHIFSYQIGAVTTLPPLQESRPEILGLNEVGGAFLAKTSFEFPSCFFVSTVSPPEFWGNLMEQKRCQLSLDSETASASEGSNSNMGFVTNFMVSPLMDLLPLLFYQSILI